MAKVLLTGGGTAGHVTPNLALVPYLKELGMEIEYMGTYDGIEKQLMEEHDIPYTGISSGKLRRYMSLKNLSDPFRVIKGYNEAKKYMKEKRPDCVFSKGGFVAVPVIYAASKYHIPIILHEADLTPGLANKLCIPKATCICYNFPETAEFLEGKKAIHTGEPVRDELFRGDKKRGLDFCGFNEEKPVLLVIGGSLGSVLVNNAVREALPELLEKFQIIHICGEGKKDDSKENTEGYRQFEYVDSGLNDLFAAADIIISRAGANIISEITALAKPSLLIPLGTNASRGDQVLNAESVKKRGLCEVLPEEELTKESLLLNVNKVYENREKYIAAMKAEDVSNVAKRIARLIAKAADIRNKSIEELKEDDAD